MRIVTFSLALLIVLSASPARAQVLASPTRETAAKSDEAKASGGGAAKVDRE